MSTPSATRRVGVELSFDVAVDSRLALQVAVAETESLLEERLLLAGSAPAGNPGAPARDHGGGRIQLVDVGRGRLDVTYSATVGPDGAPAEPAPLGFGIDQLVALRQSRYCPSDRLAGFAAANFAGEPDPVERARQIAAWVFEHLAYEPGSSRSTDSAIDTLLGGEGVCRDFAHLTITLCRAVGVPARLVSVYAPGLSPMDFHAVTEVWGGTAWEVLDATRMAPRSSLVRIATGRDAADTAFATVIHGDVRFLSYEVFAIVDGDLPLDDHVSAVKLG